MRPPWYRGTRANDDATRSSGRVPYVRLDLPVYGIGFTRRLCRAEDNPGIVGSLMSARRRSRWIIVVPRPLFVRYNDDFKPVITSPCSPCCLAGERLENTADSAHTRCDAFVSPSCKGLPRLCNSIIVPWPDTSLVPPFSFHEKRRIGRLRSRLSSWAESLDLRKKFFKPFHK